MTEFVQEETLVALKTGACSIKSQAKLNTESRFHRIGVFGSRSAAALQICSHELLLNLKHGNGPIIDFYKSVVLSIL